MKQKPSYRYWLCLLPMLSLLVMPTLHRLDTHERHIHEGISWHEPTHHDHDCDICISVLFQLVIYGCFVAYFSIQLLRFTDFKAQTIKATALHFQARAPPRLGYAQI